MKRRNINYITRQKAFRKMWRFDDLTSFLLAGFHTSKSLVVKKDIINMLLQVKAPHLQLASA
ncbi:MAG TPA: hypothetical protein VL098_02460 [Flavipsychrobacter sp.]|nr:hypothetical protein [Flavipsychrobacter sp.]